MFGYKNKAENSGSVVITQNTLDEGMRAFGQWLSSENKQSGDNTLLLKQYVKDKYAILIDNRNKKLPNEAIVNFSNDVPMCRACNASDCAHVGFFICIQQMVHSQGYIEE